MMIPARKFLESMSIYSTELCYNPKYFFLESISVCSTKLKYGANYHCIAGLKRREIVFGKFYISYLRGGSSQAGYHCDPSSLKI